MSSVPMFHDHHHDHDVPVHDPPRIDRIGHPGRADKRRQITEAPEYVREQFRSVGALIPITNLQQNYDGSWQLKAPSMIEQYPIASTEPFAKEPVAAAGAAFLIYKQVVLTAFHVAPSVQIARQLRLVFGYQMNGDLPPKRFPGEDVYEITPFWWNRRSDVALCMVDRAVRTAEGAARPLLTPRLDNEVGYSEPLYVVGFPLGLPGKFAEGGRVMDKTSAFFNTDLHVMRGNSGSPVFSAETREAVGVVSTAPLGMTPRGGVFAFDFSQDAGDVRVGISKMTNVRKRPE